MAELRWLTRLRARGEETRRSRTKPGSVCPKRALLRNYQKITTKALGDRIALSQGTFNIPPELTLYATPRYS